jgi:hypothetical protein
MASLGCITAANTQESKSDEANIERLITGQRFIFKAQSAHPARGRMRDLSSEYDVLVTPDTVRSYLPYFGRAYSPSLDPRGGGIDFTSTSFDYSKKPKRKGGWEISIKPKDVRDIREMILTIFKNGSASLRVQSNNREVISFNGYVAEK